jgi:hypothetical protein
MASNQTPLTNEFDLNQVSYSDIKRRPSNDSRYVNAEYTFPDGETDHCCVQFPKMALAFGAMQADENDHGYKKFAFSLSLDCNQSKINEFTDIVKGLDEMNIDWGVENGEKVWGKVPARTTVEDAMYKTVVKYSTKINESTGQPWDPTIKLRLPFSSKGKPLFKLEDSKKADIEIPDLVDEATGPDTETVLRNAFEKGCRVMGIIKFKQFWFIGKGYGMTCDLVCGRIYPSNRGIQRFSIRDDPDDPDDPDEADGDDDGEEKNSDADVDDPEDDDV